MKRSIIFVAAAVAAALASPSVSGAQAPTGDSVVGTGVAVSRQFIVDAHSGPSGESPSGTYMYGDGFIGLQGPVTCLSVTGNRAVVGGQATSPFGGLIGVVAVIVDNGAAGPDTLVMAMVPAVPLVCPAGLPAPPDRSPRETSWSLTRRRCPRQKPSASTAAGGTTRSSRTRGSA